MFDREVVDALTGFLRAANGTMDKAALSKAVQDRFRLVSHRSVYSCAYFSIRFCQAAGKNFSNTVLSLSALQKYDDRPFVVCVVTPDENIPLLANTTFLGKISHSSQELRTDNIKGSFNGSDIMKSIGGLENKPENFEILFSVHESFTFAENLQRLVEKTNEIVPSGKRFEPTHQEAVQIRDAPFRAQRFLASDEYLDLRGDLDRRIGKVKKEIAIASKIDNVNIRGRIIEALITSDGGALHDRILHCLRTREPLPKFKTEDQLADYRKEYGRYKTATEIKTKALFLTGNPKAYNIDKLLSFLAQPRSVYMIYIVGIHETGEIAATLCSAFDKRLLDGTLFLFHWAGRNSRGVTQFMGNSLLDILNTPEGAIDIPKANSHIEKMLSL